MARKTERSRTRHECAEQSEHSGLDSHHSSRQLYLGVQYRHEDVQVLAEIHRQGSNVGCTCCLFRFSRLRHISNSSPRMADGEGWNSTFPYSTRASPLGPAIFDDRTQSPTTGITRKSVTSQRLCDTRRKTVANHGVRSRNHEHRPIAFARSDFRCSQLQEGTRTFA